LAFFAVRGLKDFAFFTAGSKIVVFFNPTLFRANSRGTGTLRSKMPIAEPGLTWATWDGPEYCSLYTYKNEKNSKCFFIPSHHQSLVAQPQLVFSLSFLVIFSRQIQENHS
jgi:hypothetical protein